MSNMETLKFCLILIVSGTVSGSKYKCGEPTKENPDIRSDNFKVNILQQPWLVSLGIFGSNGSWIHQCGGSIVTNHHVLTAAHCFENIGGDASKLESYFMRFGEADLSAPVNPDLVRNVKEIITHPRYQSGRPYFDVGLAIAKTPIKFSDYVIPVCLPMRPVDDVDYLEGDLVTLAGWGSFYDKKNKLNEASKDLKLINLRVLPKGECENLYSDDYVTQAGIPKFKLRSQLPKGFGKDISCVGNPFKVEGACEGDSGSPVIRVFEGTARGKPFYEQHLIVSTGLDCRLPATIYVRVTDRDILPWIQNITNTAPILMVVGGSNENGLLNDVELISETNTEECSKSVSPMKDGENDGRAQGLTGQFTFNAPIVCGGKNDDDTLNTCYEYKQDSNTWIKIPSTNQHRYESASILDADGNMWILGGGTKDLRGFDSTEYYQYKPNGKGVWKKGKPLPGELRDTGITSHCAVRINNTHTFLAGGFAYITEAFDPLYRPPVNDEKPEEGLVPRKGLNPEDELTANSTVSRRRRQFEGEAIQFQSAWIHAGYYWEEVAEMIETRDRAACSLFQTAEGKIRILVAGGCSGWCQDSAFEALTSAEMYVPEEDEWYSANYLPEPIHSAKMEVLNGIPTLVGGYNANTKKHNDVLYQYFHEDGEWRPHATLRMRIPRSSPAVFQVPRGLTDACFPEE